MSQGWAVRAHGKARKRPYHPVHGRVPFEVAMLSSERTTVRFPVQGNDKLLRQDDWRDSARTEDDVAWRGYTFLKLKRSATVVEELHGEAASSVGSYEMVDS